MMMIQTISDNEEEYEEDYLSDYKNNDKYFKNVIKIRFN